MAYQHKGIAGLNGSVNNEVLQEGAPQLNVHPPDDGLHITDKNTGDFEWWYFDVVDHSTGVFLKIVFHIGTDPLRTKVFPQLAVSINVPGYHDDFTKTYDFTDIETGIKECNILVREELEIRSVHNEYIVDVFLPDFRCELVFKPTIEAWKPLGNKVEYQYGKKKGDFSWVIPVPRAVVSGSIKYGDNPVNLTNAIGYHDHNYIKPDPYHPLYLDELVKRWYWGKCYAGSFTVIFMETWSGKDRTGSLLVANENKIIQSSNINISCLIQNEKFDSELQSRFPSRINILSQNEEFPFKADFEMNFILDKKDLLESVHPFISFFIKRLVSRPVYFGVIADAVVWINGTEFRGYGNYEMMKFRG